VTLKIPKLLVMNSYLRLQGFFSFCHTSRPTMGPTWPTTKWVPESVPWG